MGTSERTVSGTAFVAVAAVLAVAFVVFLLTGGRLLHERTLAAAPPLAPQQVASGETAGASWTATAHEPEPETPCLRVEIAGTPATELCTGVRGGDLRTLQAVQVGDGSAGLLAGIVDPRVSTVRLEGAGGRQEVEPGYVDFGFPLGFFVVALDAGTDVQRVVALDREDEVRDVHECSAGDRASGDEVPAARCAFDDPLYSGGQG